MNKSKNKISVVGLGFVGLSLAVTNANKGFPTIGVDIKNEKISNLKKGIPDFFEPKLDKMLKEAIEKKKIQFTTKLDYAIKNSNITFLTVGTPLKKNNTIDLSFTKNAIKKIFLAVKNKKQFHLLVVKSTLPPLTTQNFILPVFRKLIKLGKMDIVVNPEFLREGFAIDDLLKPHLIVIGSNKKRSSLMLENYYQKFYKNPPEMIHTNIPTAELIKYANNAFLATKISFINSIASMCQNIPESDVNSIAYAIGKDSRIGPLFLKAGPGFGGSCLPKDLSGLINFSQKIGKNSEFFKAVKEVNDSQYLRVIELMKEQKVLKKNNTIAILGLAFKKDTDDVREAVSVRIIKKLLRLGLKIKVHDPMAIENVRKIFGKKITYHLKINECIKNSNCCLLLTEWEEYFKLQPSYFKKYMKKTNLIDARRILEPEKFSKLNFKAVGLGN